MHNLQLGQIIIPVLTFSSVRSCLRVHPLCLDAYVTYVHVGVRGWMGCFSCGHVNTHIVWVQAHFGLHNAFLFWCRLVEKLKACTQGSSMSVFRTAALLGLWHVVVRDVDTWIASWVESTGTGRIRSFESLPQPMPLSFLRTCASLAQARPEAKSPQVNIRKCRAWTQSVVFRLASPQSRRPQNRNFEIVNRIGPWWPSVWAYASAILRNCRSFVVYGVVVSYLLGVGAGDQRLSCRRALCYEDFISGSWLRSLTAGCHGRHEASTALSLLVRLRRLLRGRSSPDPYFEVRKQLSDSTFGCPRSSVASKIIDDIRFRGWHGTQDP